MKVYELINQLQDCSAGSEVNLYFETGKQSDIKILELMPTTNREENVFIVLKGKR